MISKEVLRQRTDDSRNGVEAFARHHKVSIAWAEKGLRKQDHVLPAFRRRAYGVYCICKSMEPDPTHRPHRQLTAAYRQSTGMRCRPCDTPRLGAGAQFR
jgi:hypothetical protein